MIKKLLSLIALGLLLPSFAFGATVFPYQGGTGASSTPSLGTLLVGQNQYIYGLLGAGTNGTCLIANSAATYGLNWATCATGGGGGTNFFSSSTPNFIFPTDTSQSLGVGGNTASTTKIFLQADGTAILNQLNNVIVKANGRVGIGTAAPTEVLNVVGGSYLNGSSTIGTLYVVASTTLQGLGGGFVKSGVNTGLLTSQPLIVLTTDVSGLLPIANGGTASSTVAASGLFLVSNGTRFEYNGISGGTNIAVSKLDGNFNVGLTGLVAVANGGTASSTTPPANKFLVGNGTRFEYNGLSAGSNITISKLDGNYQISSTGGGTISGSGLANQVTLWTDGTTIGGTTGFTFATSTPLLTVPAFTTTGTSTIGGNIFPTTDNVTENGTTTKRWRSLSVGTGDLTASGTLSVSGITDLGSSLQVTSNANLLSTLNVTGLLTSAAGITDTGTLTNNGTSSLRNVFPITDNLYENGTTTLRWRSLSIGTGATTASGTLSASGATSLGSSLQVTSNANLLSTLNVAGLTTLTAGLTDTGNFTQTGTSTLSGLLLPGTDDLYENGTTTKRWRSLSIGTGAVTASGTLSVSGAASLGSTLQVSGLTTIGGTLTINVTGSTQCLHVNTSGVVSGTGSDCGSGGGGGGGSGFFSSSTPNFIYPTDLTQDIGLGSATASNTLIFLSHDGPIKASKINVGLGTVSVPTYSFSGDLNTGLWSSGADTLNWSTGGIEGMRLTSGQLLGIGTTSPSTTLHVVGTSQFTATSTLQGNTTAMSFFTGPSFFDTNAGILNWQDMVVDATPAAGTVESYTASLNGNPAIMVYGLASGSGLTAASTSIVFATSTAPSLNQTVLINGHVAYTGALPTVSSCGTSPTMGVGSTDMAGIVNVGSVTATACTVNFNKQMVNPTCTISDDSAGVITAGITGLTINSFTVSFSASLAGGHIYYHCDDLRTQ